MSNTHGGAKISFRLGLTIDRIYSLLEQCTDGQFLICLLSLLHNLFCEHATSLLPIFNATRLITVGQTLEFQYFNLLADCFS